MERVSLGCSGRKGCIVGSLPDAFSQIFFSSITGNCYFYGLFGMMEWNEQCNGMDHYIPVSCLVGLKEWNDILLNIDNF